MKLYEDIPEDQRHLLTRIEIDELCTAELATLGYTRPKVPVFEAENDVDINTKTFFFVDGEGYSKDFNALFESAEDAKAFIALNPKKRDYVHNGGDVLYQAQAVCGLTISSVEMPTEADLLGVQPAKVEAAEARQRNATLRQEFETETKVCNDLVESVLTEWRDRIETERSRQALRDVFEEFVSLADGNQAVAAKFMLKRNSLKACQDAIKGFSTPTVEVKP